jgi:hypothetical protein
MVKGFDLKKKKKKKKRETQSGAAPRLSPRRALVDVGASLLTKHLIIWWPYQKE